MRQMNQREFARLIGKRQSTISKLENLESGLPSVQTLLEIARELGVGLMIKFVSYPELLTRAADAPPSGLGPENIYQSLEAERKSNRRRAER